MPWMAWSGHVQDERYAAVPWMAWSGHVQDERYAAVPWMAWSGHAQDERYAAMPWMAWSGHVQDDDLLRLVINKLNHFKKMIILGLRVNQHVDMVVIDQITISLR